MIVVTCSFDYTGDLLLNDGSDILVDNAFDLMLHDTPNLPAHYLTHLLLYCPRHYFPDGIHDLSLYDDLRSVLHDTAQLFRYGLSDLSDVRYLGDGLLHKREALVNRFAHASDGLQDRVQLRLLSPATSRNCLPRSLLFFQSTPVQSPIVDLRA
jgi:hypothetical protein